MYQICGNICIFGSRVQSVVILWHPNCFMAAVLMAKPQPNSLNSICTVSLPPVSHKQGAEGWKEKGEACDSTVLPSQCRERKRLETEGKTAGQTEECCGGEKTPSSNRMGRFQCQSESGTKATLCPQDDDNYSSSEQLLRQRLGTLDGREGWREKKGWPGEKQNQKVQVKQEWLQQDSAFWVKVRKTVMCNLALSQNFSLLASNKQRLKGEKRFLFFELFNI